MSNENKPDHVTGIVYELGDGTPVRLEVLCANDPSWAANRIRAEWQRAERAEAECKVAAQSMSAMVAKAMRMRGKLNDARTQLEAVLDRVTWVETARCGGDLDAELDDLIASAKSARFILATTEQENS